MALVYFCLYFLLFVFSSFAFSYNAKTYNNYVSIEDFGALDSTSNANNMHNLFDVASFNSLAIKRAFNLANATNKVVVVPNKIFYISAIQIENMTNIQFVINGTLIAHDHIELWPTDKNGKVFPIFSFTNMMNFTIIGNNGTVDGQGYKWWWAAILSATGKTVDDRPHMFLIKESIGFELFGLTMKNSPLYHLKLYDMINLHLHHFEIDVDVVSQKYMMDLFFNSYDKQFKLFKHFNLTVPTFPLNTDGVDPYAVNVSIHDFKINNFDDAIAVKPCNLNFKYCKCSSNVIVSNGHVTNSVGLAIGSVAPNNYTNCVNNVIFQNITMSHPIKAIYVKTNRGSHGNGVISNIKYENIFANTPTWWPIYIGPQQQKQPGGAGEGCMLYPYGQYCPTEPRITLFNIILNNITIVNSVNPYVGVIRCNETNPCNTIYFNNVNTTTLLKPLGYLCENVNVWAYNSLPTPCK